MTVGNFCKNVFILVLFCLVSEYGLFIIDTQHPSRSYWLDSTKTLNYYVLKNGV
jgi:hypothetical protein